MRPQRVLAITTLIFVSAIDVLFAYQVLVGDKVIHSSQWENKLTWQDFVEIVTNYMSYLQLTKPSHGSVGDFEYLVWNNHVVGYSKSTGLLNLDGVTEKTEDIPLKKILNVFGIPVEVKDRSLYLPEMLIWDISKTEDIVELAFNGVNRLRIFEEKGRLMIISAGLVAWNGKLFATGQELWSVELQTGTKIQQISQLDGLLKVIVGKPPMNRHEFEVLPLDQWSTASTDGILVLYAKGDSRIIIRPFSPDFEGSDWYSFSYTKKLAVELCKEYSLKLEICPLVCLPVNRVAMLVLAREGDLENLLESISHKLRELLGE